MIAGGFLLRPIRAHYHVDRPVARRQPVRFLVGAGRILLDVERQRAVRASGWCIQKNAQPKLVARAKGRFGSTPMARLMQPGSPRRCSCSAARVPGVSPLHVVEDDPDGVLHAGADAAHAVAKVHAVGALRSLHRPITVVLAFSRARALSVRMSSFVQSHRFTIFFSILISPAVPADAGRS